ncbi:MAG: DUF192 domain-containing protein [bacterium]
MFVLIAIFLFLFLIFALGFLKKTNQKSFSKCVEINKKIIKVELANTIFKRAKGLSGRPSLAQDEGMLFIFSDYAQHPFWMKEMNFSLDIIWLRDKEIVDISQNISPETFPQSFAPKVPVNYVLEVKADFSKENNIKIGQMVSYLDCQK